MSEPQPTSSGTTRDVPVMPNPRVTYAPASKTVSSYTVRLTASKS